MATTQPATLTTVHTPPRPRASNWITVAFVLALAVAGGALIRFGTGQAGTELALKLTARLGFLFFWPAYAGGALARLMGARFDSVARRGRELGLAFASVLAVHLSLVAWISWIGDAPGVRTFVIFGLGVVCAALLVLASIKRLGTMIGPWGWWALRNLAMTYLLFDFAYDFFRVPPIHSRLVFAFYVPFQILVVLAVALRLSAWLKTALHRDER